MSSIYGLYDDGSAAQAAVDALRACGTPDESITIATPYPMDGFEFFHRDARTWMWWVACAGSALGLTAGAALLWVGETRWPIDVGGLPTFAWWPNLIIMFELTMLGGILATVVSLVVTAGFGRTTPPYDAAVSDGLILVGVAPATTDSVPALERTLVAAGARQVVTRA